MSTTRESMRRSHWRFVGQLRICILLFVIGVAAALVWSCVSGHAVLPLSTVTFTQSSALSVELIAVVSMQRSSSTWLLDNVLAKEDCVISLNEVFSNDTEQSGDAWLMDGKDLHGPIEELDPPLLVDFLQHVANRKCTDAIQHKTCKGRCIAGFKAFPEHLSFEQHEWIWRHTPGMTIVVLERNVQDRWESRYVAAATQDWDTTGSMDHKKLVEETEVPPLSESEEFCNSDDWLWKQLCGFETTHNEWFTFVRSTLSAEERVEVSFEDVVLNDGESARAKIGAALPNEFQDILLLD